MQPLLPNKKAADRYVTVYGNVKMPDGTEHAIIMADRTKTPITDCAILQSPMGLIFNTGDTMKKELPHFAIGSAYGGSQDWCTELWMKIGGCAAVTACDSSIFFMLHKGRRELYPYALNDISRRDYVDFTFVIGDAYVDHPSFGPAIVSRVLESAGYRVGIIAQPDWKNPESINVFGEPRLAFLISAGNMDSMVNHYSVSKKRRAKDFFTAGGVMGKRPDHATVVYGNLIRQTYKNKPIIAGGIEASLRRMAHYDYWDNCLKRSVLLDAQADIVSFGMGEHSMVEIADALNNNIPVEDITFIKGTVYKTKSLENIYDYIELPSYKELKADKLNYARSFYTQYTNTDPFSGKVLVEPYDDIYVVQNPMSKPLTQEEMDKVYALPYMRTYHPIYEKDGGIDAIKEVKFSLVSNRGCFGGCSFCALTFHQGRIIQTRSHQSSENYYQRQGFQGIYT